MKHAVIPAAGVAVMLACAPALGAATVKSGKSAGTTDKGTPVSLKVTASKQSVDAQVLEGHPECSGTATSSCPPGRSTRAPRS